MIRCPISPANPRWSPFHNLPLENQAAPDAGPQRQPNPVGNLSSGPDPTFADAEDIGIVFQQDRDSQTSFELRPQGVISHRREVGRKDHPAPLMVDLSRNAKADSRHLTGKVLCRFDLRRALGNQLLCGVLRRPGQYR